MKRLIASLCATCCAMMFAANVQAAYNVTIVASGSSSGGTWVVDTWTPNSDDSTVLAAEVETHLGNGPTTISTGGGGSQNGDIVVDGAVSWSANTLTLSAAGDIDIDAALTGTGTAKLALEYGQGTVAAGNGSVYRIATLVNLKSDPTNPTTVATFSTKRGSDGTVVGRAVPRCPINTIGGLTYDNCPFLVGSDPAALDIQYKTVEVNGAADSDIWVYVDGRGLFDVGTTYYPKAMACQVGQGVFNYANSDAQAQHFDGTGTITNQTGIESTTTYSSPACKTWDAGPVLTFFSSDRFPNGYYLKFRADAAESGVGYQTVSMMFTGTATAITGYTVIDYVFNVVPDTTPDVFTFPDKPNVARTTQIESDPITVTGITNTATISVTGGAYEINADGNWTTTAGTVNNNDTVKVRHTSSANYATATDTVLTIGTRSDTFSTTTLAAPDITPDGFSFIDQSGVALSTQTVSNVITVTGIDSAAPISVTGGQYRIIGGNWTADDGTVNPNAGVQLSLISSAANLTTTGATLTIGGISATFNVTTHASFVVGACGDANGVATAFMPSANLCAAGTAGAATVGSPWTWVCAGWGGGASAACSAPNQDTGTGNGTGRAVVSGGTWEVDSALSAGFIPVTGHAKSPPSLPPGYSFPHGLLDFRLIGGAAGSAGTLTITYPSALPENAVYWKYGPSPAGYNCSGTGCAVAHWYQMPPAQAVIAGNTVTLTITDGGVGDDDLAANGVIVDQGGPGVLGSAVSIPTLSEWGVLLLSLLLAATALAHHPDFKRWSGSRRS